MRFDIEWEVSNTLRFRQFKVKRRSFILQSVGRHNSLYLACLRWKPSCEFFKVSQIGEKRYLVGKAVGKKSLKISGDSLEDNIKNLRV